MGELKVVILELLFYLNNYDKKFAKYLYNRIKCCFFALTHSLGLGLVKDWKVSLVHQRDFFHLWVWVFFIIFGITIKRVAMITSLSQLDLNKKYSYAEYLTWQFQEHLELIRGRIFRMTPAPTRRHQKASFKLSLQIGNYLNNRSCEVYTAPFDVRFPKEGGDDNTYTVVQPDICVICDKSKLDDRGCVGAPDFIIEILSPTTGAKDATIKFDLYEEQGGKGILDGLSR